MTDAATIEGVHYRLVESAPLEIEVHSPDGFTGFRFQFTRKPDDRQRRDILEQVHRNLSISAATPKRTRRGKRVPGNP